MKSIHFNFEGKDYTLEYNRKAIEMMERRGFVASDLSDKPMTTLPLLFAGAFHMHHPYIKRDVIDRIFDKLGSKAELMTKLVEMYNEPMDAMMDEPNEGNVEWSASW